MFSSLNFRASYICSRKTIKSIFTRTMLQRKTTEHLPVLQFSSLPYSKYILRAQYGITYVYNISLFGLISNFYLVTDLHLHTPS